MKPEIIQNGEFIEVIGHYDDEVQCAKMTLLAELYAVEHRDGYAKFRLEDADKLGLVNERLEFARISIDLTTLSGWSGLSDGSHSITVKAKATGYRDSEASQAVSVTKAPAGYTVVLNPYAPQTGSYCRNAAYYSLDNINWTELDMSEPVQLQNITSIYLRSRSDSYGDQALFYNAYSSNIPSVKSKIISEGGGYDYTLPSSGVLFDIDADGYISIADASCLASDTLVKTNNGLIEIKDLSTDSIVLTYNPDTATNEYKKVSKWWHHPSRDLVTINNGLFTMTGDHPIYINDYEVVKGREVKVGDYLIDKDGNKVLVEKVEFSNEPIEVYMIEVEDNHNFYITDKNLLSHNY